MPTIEDWATQYKTEIDPLQEWATQQKEPTQWWETEPEPEKETKFMAWYKNIAAELDINPDPDDPRHYYDYRGYWEKYGESKAGMAIDPIDKKWHFPDEFKLEGHPTYPEPEKEPTWWESAWEKTKGFGEWLFPKGIQDLPRQYGAALQKGGMAAGEAMTWLTRLLPGNEDRKPYAEQTTAEQAWTVAQAGATFAVTQELIRAGIASIGDLKLNIKTLFAKEQSKSIKQAIDEIYKSVVGRPLSDSPEAVARYRAILAYKKDLSTSEVTRLTNFINKATTPALPTPGLVTPPPVTTVAPTVAPTTAVAPAGTQALAIKTNDIISDGLVRGRVLGEIILGKNIPAYKIEILAGHAKGQISAIVKNQAELEKPEPEIPIVSKLEAPTPEVKPTELPTIPPKVEMEKTKAPSEYFVRVKKTLTEEARDETGLPKLKAVEKYHPFQYSNIDLFVHRSIDNPKLWRVSEKQTGLLISGYHKTIKEAKADAIRIIKKQTLGKVEREIEANIKDIIPYGKELEAPIPEVKPTELPEIAPKASLADTLRRAPTQQNEGMVEDFLDKYQEDIIAGKYKSGAELSRAVYNAEKNEYWTVLKYTLGSEDFVKDPLEPSKIVPSKIEAEKTFQRALDTIKSAPEIAPKAEMPAILEKQKTYWSQEDLPIIQMLDDAQQRISNAIKKHGTFSIEKYPDGKAAILNKQEVFNRAWAMKRPDIPVGSKILYAPADLDIKPGEIWDSATGGYIWGPEREWVIDKVTFNVIRSGDQVLRDRAKGMETSTGRSYEPQLEISTTETEKRYGYGIVPVREDTIREYDFDKIKVISKPEIPLADKPEIAPKAEIEKELPPSLEQEINIGGGPALGAGIELTDKEIFTEPKEKNAFQKTIDAVSKTFSVYTRIKKEYPEAYKHFREFKGGQELALITAQEANKLAWGEISKGEAMAVQRAVQMPEEAPASKLPENLQETYKRVTDILDDRKQQLIDMGKMEVGWPQSYINQLEKEKEKVLAEAELLTQKRAIAKRQLRIKEIDELEEILSKREFFPGRYLARPETQPQILRLLPEGKYRNSQIRSNFIAGKTITDIDKAIEYGLEPIDPRASLMDYLTWFENEKNKWVLYQGIKDDSNLAVKPTKNNPAPEPFVEPIGISELTGYKINPLVGEVLDEFNRSSTFKGVAKAYAQVAKWGKMFSFHNPIIMGGIYDPQQGYMAAGVRVFNPVTFVESLKSALTKDEFYKKCVQADLFPKPVDFGPQKDMDKFVLSIASQMDKDVPQFTRFIEKMTDGEWDFKGKTNTQKMIGAIKGLYSGMWKVTWGLDAASRETTVKALQAQGWPFDKAVERARFYHADYGDIPADTRRFANYFMWTPSYQISMAKVYGNMARHPIKERGPLLRLIAFQLLLAAGMSVAGYKWQDGNKFVKTIGDLQDVISSPGPLYWLNKNLARNPLNSMYWQSSVPINIVWSMERNYDGLGNRVYDPKASRAMQIAQLAEFAIERYFRPLETIRRLNDGERALVNRLLSLIAISKYERQKPKKETEKKRYIRPY